MRQTRLPATAAHAKRLEQLAAAVAAYRSDQPRRRLSHGLRAQVVAVIDAGATVRAVSEACKLSKSQISRWQQAAARSGTDAAPAGEPAFESARVLSVVDDVDTREHALPDAEIELRIGGWHISLRRAGH